MAKASVWQEFKWQCTCCGEINSIGWMPHTGRKLPECGACGNKDTCADITMDCEPNPKPATVKRK